jgi:hypothetical protein
MRASVVTLAFALFPVSFALAADAAPNVPLVVPAGAPLRVYLTKRIPKRFGAPVEAKLLEPLYAFDRQVVPAGVRVLGHVSRLESLSKAQRASAILNGDFTPLHQADIEFTTLVMPDGRQIPLDTVETSGFNARVPLRPPKPEAPRDPDPNAGLLARGKQTLEDQIHTQVERVKSVPDILRSDKRETVTQFLMSELPYHPQYILSRTRFDAELRKPLVFGSETIPPAALALGSQPAADSVVEARLITPLNSSTSQIGQAVQAVLARPLFTADHKLVLPEGTLLDGTVVVARKARRFHRGGQLRFNFQSIELPPEAAALESAGRTIRPAAAATRPPARLQFRTEATLQSAESTGKVPLKVDSEGGVQTKESKKRFIAPAISAMIARSAADNDPARLSNGTMVGPSSNVGGRTLGGASGFGLLGAAASQSSRLVGAAFGYYGMAWSVYTNVIARGAEVEFGKNAMIDIRFNSRLSGTGTKLQAAAGR